jgi:hypothetical protein
MDISAWGFKDKAVAERLKRFAEQGGRGSSVRGYSTTHGIIDPYPVVRRILLGVVTETVPAARWLEGEIPGFAGSAFSNTSFFESDFYNQDVEPEYISPFFGSGFYGSNFFEADFLDGGDGQEPTHPLPSWKMGRGKALIYRKVHDWSDVLVQPVDLRNEDQAPFEVEVFNFTKIEIPATIGEGNVPDKDSKFHVIVEDCWGAFWILPGDNITSIAVTTALQDNMGGPTGTASITRVLSGDHDVWSDDNIIDYYNTFSQDWEEGDVGIAIKRGTAAYWEMFKPGGTSSDKMVYFELTSNKNYLSTTVMARKVLPDGSVDMVSDPIQLVDEKQRFYGRTGYRGHAHLFGTATVEGVGTVEKYRIVEMESKAHLLVSILYNTYNPAGTLCTDAEVDISGSPTRNKTQQTSPYTVYDILGVASAAQPGEPWLVAFDQIFEVYTFIAPLTSNGHQVFRFEATADKDWNDLTVSAVLLDDADVSIAAVTLTDRLPSKHEVKDGSRGWCVTHGGGFYIITVDSPARFIEGTLDAGWALTSSSATITLTKYWGAAPNHLLPTGTITIWDDQKVRTRNYYEDETFRAIWDEKAQLFVATDPPGDYITIKGTISSNVDRDDATFTLNEPSSVNGLLPTGTITVKNDPPINSPGGREVYARYNMSAGSTPQTAWDTGDAHNFILIYRGLEDWNDSDRMTVDKHGTDDPHWHKVGTCDPPPPEA